jgi:methylmalonyl-CoA mutase C-terminal domain/subunit
MGTRPRLLTSAEQMPLRVVIAKVGLDGHEVGARVVARGLVDCGFDVVYLGLRRTPEQVARAALQEDATAVGVSVLSGAHLTLLPQVRKVLDEHGLEHVVLVAGGIIPDADVPILEAAGVARVFHPGTSVAEIAAFLRAAAQGRPTA